MSQKKLTRAVVGCLVFGVVVALIVAFHRDDKPEVMRGKPPVFLVSIDTLRADHLGCYGYGRDTSPNIDRFARQEAVLFENAIAQAPSTEASHASIFTSLIPTHHGAFFSRRLPLPDGAMTMAEILKTNGYRTFSVNGSGQVSAIFGFSQGFDDYVELDRETEAESFRATVDRGMALLSEKGMKKPAFAFLHTYETHVPYAPAPRYLKQIGHRDSGVFGERGVTKDDLKLINKDLNALSEVVKQDIIAYYDAGIRSVDDSFAELVKALRVAGIYEDSLIIFTSDHGEELGERTKMGWHSHALWDEQLHVPLIVKFPRGKYAGKRVSSQVRSIDILPTVLDVLGIDPLPVFEGQTLTPLIETVEPFVRPAISQQDTKREYIPVTLRTGDWKYYSRSDEESRLFHIAKDPKEKTDVTQEEPEKVEEMKRRLRELLSPGSRPELGAPIEIDGELRKQLEALGYIQP